MEGIPALILIDSQGQILNAKGRGAIGSDPEGDKFPWPQEAVEDISSPDGINDTASLVLLVERLDGLAEKDRLLQEFTSLAKEINKPKQDKKYLFFSSTTNNNVAKRIRELTKLEDNQEAQVVLLDLGDEGKFYNCDCPITASDLSNFLTRFEKGELVAKSVQ